MTTSTRREALYTHPVGADDSQGTSFASHIDPSRSANMGIFGYGTGGG